MEPKVQPISWPLPPGQLPQIQALSSLALGEGHHFLDRLLEGLESGRNRFQKPGEVLLGIFFGEELWGIGGLNLDPYQDDPKLGRLRHFYVHPKARRRGVGRQLARALLAKAEGHFSRVRLRTRCPRAGAFYRSLGFQDAPGEAQTHEIEVAPYPSPQGDPMQIQLVQMNSGPNPEANLAWLRQELTPASPETEESPWIFLPENALALGTPDQIAGVAEPFGEGPCQEALSQLSKDLGAYLVVGSFPIEVPRGGREATCLVFDPQGVCQARYGKLHLFDVEVVGDRDGKDFSYRESDSYRPGLAPQLASLGGIQLGLSICYDLRFPGLFQFYRQEGAQVLSIPAAFTQVTGEAHWEVLLRARAIETQCFVVAAGQTGTHPDGRSTFGHSLVVDPWGKVLLDAGIEPGVFALSLDLESLARVRARMPVAQHRRFSSQLEAPEA